MKEILHIDHCPVCKASEFNTVLTASDWLVSKEQFDVLACKNCSFRFTQDAPSESNIGPYYDTDSYVEHSDSNKGLVFQIYHFGRKLMLNRKLKLIRRASKGKELLDVGSASGYFLNHMKVNNYAVTGIEISPKARELCKTKFNIETFSPEALINNDLGKNFDLITMWHVFEHVYTYDEYFNSFKALLNTDGKLLIAMPNYRCLDAKYYKEYWNGYDVPRHLWHFDPESFKTFAENRGFTIKEAKRLPLDPFYNSMVSAEYKTNFTFIGWTFIIGLMSYLNSLFDKSKSSSLVYILERKD